MEYLQAFLVGGLLCLIGQILVDKTSLTPARILVCYVVGGVVLGGLGIYEPIVKFGGAGATVPLTGFGYNLAKGVRVKMEEDKVEVELSVLMAYGYTIPEMGKSIQEGVKNAIESMTGLEVACVNVNVGGITLQPKE